MAANRTAMNSRNNLGSGLYAAGFNAFGQLRDGSVDDVHCFEQCCRGQPGEKLSVLFISWSSITITSGSRVFSKGFQRLEHVFDNPDCRLSSGIGDADGLKACIDQLGRLYIVEGPTGSKQTLVCRTIDESPRIDHLAMAENGRVALTVSACPGTCEMREFPSFREFCEWFDKVAAIGQSYKFEGQAKQLVSGTATFALLANGVVYTWGDARFQSLGRPICTESPASAPGVVKLLEGQQIIEIAASGWMTAAVGKLGGLYLWGRPSAKLDNTELKIPGLEAGEPLNVIELPDTKGGRSRDVVGVAIGANHIAVVAEDEIGHRNLLMIGDNGNGRLGLGLDIQRPAEEWNAVNLIPERAFCGPNTTIVLAEDGETIMAAGS